ncbi:hypothetical protein GCM10010289_58930 [Streptomyces violascens]|nr:hypothetical protein GCM10010289_58930 [Streptomyces violascens]
MKAIVATVSSQAVLPQQRERDAHPGQEQVEGEQHTDARVDSYREDVGEVPKALLERELADRRVRTRETDPGDHHGTRDDDADEYPVHSGEHDW